MRKHKDTERHRRPEQSNMIRGQTTKLEEEFRCLALDCTAYFAVLVLCFCSFVFPIHFERELTMRMLFMVLSMLLVDDKIADRLWESSKVVDELVKAPDSDIPKDLLGKAECVAVIPGLKKAAFGVG